MKYARPILYSVLAMSLAGCVTTEESVRKDAIDAQATMTTGPSVRPTRNVTNFSSALRCMDTYMLMYGIRDVVMVSEELNDATKKVNAGTRDMLMTAVSQMTTRSRAVKMIAYGGDSSNTLSMLREAERKSMVQVLPTFGIRGSISQLDESVAKKVEGGGIVLGPVGFGRAAVASINELGIDLNIILVEDLSIMPGVTASNKASVFRSGVGQEGEVEYKKFGLNFQTNLSKSEGQSQALRNLVELSVVELFGRLAKLPYWKCLDAQTSDPLVKQEIGDWYAGMFATPGEFVAYWQNQFRQRGIYNGEVNGEADNALADAVKIYKQAMGLSVDAKLNEEFFAAYLDANHFEVAPKAQAIMMGEGKATAAAQDNTPISLALKTATGGTQFRKGEKIVLNVQPSRDAFVYCYMLDDNKSVQRFFPNRFQKDAFVPAKKGLMLPADGRYAITASSKGIDEQVMCMATNQDVFSALPDALKVADFEGIKVRNLSEVASTFAGLGKGVTATTQLTLRSR